MTHEIQISAYYIIQLICGNEGKMGRFYPQSDFKRLILTLRDCWEIPRILAAIV